MELRIGEFKGPPPEALSSAVCTGHNLGRIRHVRPDRPISAVVEGWPRHFDSTRYWFQTASIESRSMAQPGDELWSKRPNAM
jgi:hypothetical protein